MEKTSLLPSPQLLSSPMLPSNSKYDYFRQAHEEPEKRVHFQADKKRQWQDEDESFNARGAYLTPDPSSQIGFSSPPQIRRPLSSIPILRPNISGQTITIGRSSVQCTHPIPQQWLNLHVSRVHVVLKYIPQTKEISIFCRGVNPVFVDTPYETRKIEKDVEGRFKEGEDVKINIAGYVVIVEAPEEDEDEDIVSQDTLESLRLLPSLDPPATINMEFVEPEKKRKGSLEASPLPEIHSPSPPVHDNHRSSPPPHQMEEIQIYHDETNTPRSSLSPPPEDLPSPTKRSESPSTNTSDSALLDALLTTLIFAEVKPTSLPRLLFDLSHRMPNVAQSHVLSVLTTTPCVGIVHRSGKDAAGKQLPDEYYYIPENDEDITRRERYYQFARPTRSCRLKHSQYHWRPVKLHSKKGNVHSSPGKENVGQRRKKVKKEHKETDEIRQEEEHSVSVGEPLLS